jgi:cytochrome c peroxidase
MGPMPVPRLLAPLFACLATGLAVAGAQLASAAPPAPGPAAAEVALGRRLFAEPRLSRTGSVSCASCHDPARGFSDGRPVSIGVDGRTGTRNAPSILLAAGSPTQFWDGRARTLEEQALGPIANPVEMDASPEEVARALARDAAYDRAFREVYGAAPSAPLLARAIAAYERALAPAPSRHDRWLAGEKAALTAAELRGREVFMANRCAGCHRGPDFTDHLFRNIGWGLDRPSPDPGRSAVTGDPKDFGAFKTPTLRNVAESAPYFHDGRAATLEAVVDYYDRGGHANPNLDFRVRKLGLTAGQKADLVAFMKALSGGHNDAELAR